MASQHRKHRGYKTERIVAEYLSRTWENASVGRGQGKDVQNVPFDVEIKSVSKLDIPGTLRQIKARTDKSGEIGFACFRHNGQGEAAVENYSCVILLKDLVQLLVQAGYGEFQGNVGELEPTRCDKCGAWTFKDVSCKTCARASNANI